MFTQFVPQFNRGRILKSEMLENLRDFPRNFVDIYYNEHSNGVISGAHVHVGEGVLTVRKGIVKHADRIYMLEQDVEIPYPSVGKEILLKVRFQQEVEEKDFTSYRTEMVLDDNILIQPDELELARFKLKEGARLRSDYQSFVDMATEYNTLNIIHVEYAATHKSTIHPLVLRNFAAEMLKRASKHPYDIVFAMLCLNEGVLEREVILQYISNRLGLGYKEYTNVQVHKHLGKILDDVGGSGNSRSDSRHSGMKRMIVD
ncbi:DNA and RNA helicase [Paenibacillus sp. 481]|uniref:DNA and RNA helicase n=1 Tax=Paenibacillus sp. 481 TaxID=2835869 RepID=UPI001E3410D8|nr:DNA and RNA helicase [Paenibacillus sp. 481]UHA72256.1 DNA and RNA helicase [Paenibacillus sp. 481]